MNNLTQLLFLIIPMMYSRLETRHAEDPTWPVAMRSMDDICSVWLDEREYSNLASRHAFQGYIIDVWQGKRRPHLCLVVLGSVSANAPLASNFLQNKVCLGRILQGWSRNESFIPLPGLMYLSDELVLSLNRYTYNVQSFVVVALVNISSHKTTPFYSKFGSDLIDHG